MKLGPTRLLEISEYRESGNSCLLLLVFNVSESLNLNFTYALNYLTKQFTSKFLGPPQNNYWQNW